VVDGVYHVGDAAGFLHHPQRDPHRGRRAFQDLGGQRAGSLERGPGGHDPVDQAVGEGFVGGDAAAGEDHLGGHLGRDGTRQPDGRPQVVVGEIGVEDLIKLVVGHPAGCSWPRAG